MSFLSLDFNICGFEGDLDYFSRFLPTPVAAKLDVRPPNNMSPFNQDIF